MTKPASAQEQQEVIDKYNRLNEQKKEIATKLVELETEQREHELVISTISKLEPTRKCYRMVGGVLTERTVADVLPAVTRNKDGIIQVIEGLAKDFQQTEDQVDALIKKYGLQQPGEKQSQQKKEEGKKSGGVLV